jgi:cell division protein FtsI/penicillin-binding protein 2
LKKKRRKIRRGFTAAVITAAVVLVIVLGVVVGRSIYLNIKNAKATPEELWLQYNSHISEGNYEAMYEMLDVQSKTNTSKEDFITRNKNIYEGIGARDIQITVHEGEEKDGNTVKYTLSMITDAGEISFDNEAVFSKEGDEYFLQWYDNLIFPQLQLTDKVRVTSEEAKRGELYDRNGNLLAGEGLVSSIGLVPGKMSADNEGDLEKLAELLEVSVESIEKKLSASWVKEDSFVPIKKVEQVKATVISETGETAENEFYTELIAIPGVLIQDVSGRVYPYGEAASHLVGYVQAISAEELEERADQGYTQNSVIGKSGLEKAYEERLHGVDGCKISIVDAAGNAKEVLAYQAQKDGEDITTTIDAALQELVYEQYKTDKSCSIAMNPLTGEILALVSTPSYDSIDFALGMSESKWNSLNEDESKPLQSRFLQTWCPGSSFKPVIAAVGITTGILDPDEDFGRSTTSWQADSSWGSYYVTTLHDYSEAAVLKNALIYSDNIYFAKAALKIGEDNLAKQLDKIGFGESLPFILGTSNSSYSNGEGFESQIQLADSGYGQGQVLVNPIHLASVYTAFLNNGNMIKPRLEYAQEEGAEIWIEGAFSEEAVNTVNECLIEVIENPNGRGIALTFQE